MRRSRVVLAIIVAVCSMRLPASVSPASNAATVSSAAVNALSNLVLGDPVILHQHVQHGPAYQRQHRKGDLFLLLVQVLIVLVLAHRLPPSRGTRQGTTPAAPRVGIAGESSTPHRCRTAPGRLRLRPTGVWFPALTGIRSRNVVAWFHPVDARRAQLVPFPPRHARSVLPGLNEGKPAATGSGTRLPGPVDHQAPGGWTSPGRRSPPLTGTSTTTTHHIVHSANRLGDLRDRDARARRSRLGAGRLRSRARNFPLACDRLGRPSSSKVGRARASRARVSHGVEPPGH